MTPFKWGPGQPNKDGAGAYWNYDGYVFDSNPDLPLRVFCVQEVLNNTGKSQCKQNKSHS